MGSVGEFFHKQDFGLLLIRVLLGALLMFHGVCYLMGGGMTYYSLGGAMSDVGITTWRVFWGFLGSLIYTVGGLFLILGFVFRVTCALVFLCMVVYASPYWTSGTLFKPVTPHALTLFIVSLCFIFIGPGSFSIDKK